MGQNKLEQLYPLDEKDIQAVANTRVVRADGNKSMYFIVVGMLVMVAGTMVGKTNPAVQHASMAIGAAVALYPTLKMMKLQKKVGADFLRQWKVKTQ